MEARISLRETEKKVFLTTWQDGLWDFFIGSFAIMFAIAPLLSRRLGDFWSSFVFLPFWLLIAVAVIWLKRRFVLPRMGIVKFGHSRQARLRHFLLLMLAFNLVALILGLLTSLRFAAVPGLAHTIVFSFVVLFGFSLGAYFLGLQRLFLYGLLYALAPLLGEWLYRSFGVAHHGYPITYGLTAAAIMLSGLACFFRLLRRYPLPGNSLPAGEA